MNSGLPTGESSGVLSPALKPQNLLLASFFYKIILTFGGSLFEGGCRDEKTMAEVGANQAGKQKT